MEDSIKSVGVHSLVGYDDLDGRVRDRLGTSYSLDQMYQPRIKDGPYDLTPIRYFNFFGDDSFLESLETKDITTLRERINHFIRMRNNGCDSGICGVKNIDDAMEDVRSLYKKKGEDLKSVIEKYIRLRRTITNAHLQKILRESNVDSERVLNPDDIFGKGLFILVNDSRLTILISIRKDSVENP